MDALRVHSTHYQSFNLLIFFFFLGGGEGSTRLLMQCGEEKTSFSLGISLYFMV